MKYFFDTEFIEDGRTIDLISIGIVAEDGREYYAINHDCNFSNASDWVWENVLAPMGLYSCNDMPQPQLYKSYEALQESKAYKLGWRNKSLIAREIIMFCSPTLYGEPEFWAYYADYDWVVFCQLFGTMMDLPKGFPMYCRDIKQECDRLGNPKLPEQEKGKHNALEDARWNKQAWEFLANVSI